MKITIIVNFFTNSLSQLSLIALLTRWLWTRDKYLWRKIDDSSKIDKYILKSGIRYRDNDDDDRSVGQLWRNRNGHASLSPDTV